MGYECKVLADSISEYNHRLTTMMVTFPRFILAEFNTHRMFSRNSASSRAIPVSKQIERVKADPFFPIYWGKNQPGMQAEEAVDDETQWIAEADWGGEVRHAIKTATRMSELGLHKQIATRPLELYSWHTAIVTATEWDNFFGQRLHKGAQPEFRKLAFLMRQALKASKPVLLKEGEWHLPLCPDKEELIKECFDIRKVSAGRCGRVSYLTHEGKREPQADVDLVDNKLIPNHHMSPLEHVATPLTRQEIDMIRHISNAAPMEIRKDISDKLSFVGNLKGFTQYRKLIPGESVFRSASE